MDVMPFIVGTLPATYLGVPLITKQIGIRDCKCLVDKVRAKVNNWKNKMLTYAGRLQLISSVLSSIHVYWASVFMLPKITIKDINKLLKGFMWCQGEMTKGKAKIAWDNVCIPKHQGGMGLKILNLWNEVLITKHLWNIASNKESLWVKWVNVIKLKGISIWEVKAESNSSCGWKQILNLRGKMRKHVAYQVGNGEKCFFWHDNWSGKGPMSTLIGQEAIKHKSINTMDKVRDLWSKKGWKWPKHINVNSLPQTVPYFQLQQNKNDKAVWKCNNGSSHRFATSKVAFDPLSHVRADLIPSPKRVKDSSYLADVESRGIEAWKFVVEAVDREENETGTRGLVERVTHHAMPEDTHEPAQVGAVEATYEQKDLSSESTNHTKAYPRPSDLYRDNRRLRGTASVKRALGARDGARNLEPLIRGGGEQEEISGNGGNGNRVNRNGGNGNGGNGNGG
ncbi:hypothetical protein Tco_1515308 [Tanacetum coccineum]